MLKNTLMTHLKNKILTFHKYMYMASVEFPCFNF